MAVRAPAPYLADALESLLLQSEDDWELVLVLDGPADRNIMSLIEAFPVARVDLLALEAGSGLAASLNAGLAVCRGRYVARMDADDVCLPTRFAVQLAHLDRHPEVGLVGGQVEVIDADNEHVGWRRTRVDPDAIARKLLWRNAFVHPSVVFRRDLVRSVGGYDERVVRLEDWELWLRLVGRTRMANVPDVVLRYRVHALQHSRRRSFRSTELVVLRRSQIEAARRLGRSRIGAAFRHLVWLVYQRLSHVKSIIRGRRPT